MEWREAMALLGWMWLSGTSEKCPGFAGYLEGQASRKQEMVNVDQAGQCTCKYKIFQFAQILKCGSLLGQNEPAKTRDNPVCCIVQKGSSQARGAGNQLQ